MCHFTLLSSYMLCVQFLVAGLKRDSDGTASYYLLILSELITSMTVRPSLLSSQLQLCMHP